MANKNFKARIGIEAPLIAADNGTTAITLSDNDVTVVGDLTVTSNTIKSSSATSLSLSGADVAVAGDLTITGANIGTGVNNTTIQIDRTTNSITNSAAIALSLLSTTSLTPAVGFGTALEFEAQTSASNFENAGFISVNATNIGAGTEAFNMSFGLMNAGAAYATKLTIDSLGNLTPVGNFVKGVIRNATTEANSDMWSFSSGVGTGYRGLSVDNSTNTAKAPGIVQRGFTGGALAANGTTPTMTFERARGTSAAPTAIQNGDFLGRIVATGANGAGTFLGDTVAASPATLQFNAAETFASNTNVGTTMNLSLMPTGKTLASVATPTIVFGTNPQTTTNRSDSFTWQNGNTIANANQNTKMALDNTGILTLTSSNATTTLLAGDVNIMQAASTWQSAFSPGFKYTGLMSSSTQTSSGSYFEMSSRWKAASADVAFVAPLSGWGLGRFGFSADNSTTGTSQQNAGAIQSIATENWDSTHYGSKLVFSAHKSGTGGSVNVLDMSPETTIFKSDAFTFENSAAVNLVGSKITYNRVYAQFEYNTTVTPAAADTAYVFPIGTAATGNIVTVGSTSRIIIGAAGTYNIQFSVQVNNADNGADHIAYIWLRKNGADVTGSTGRVTVVKSAATIAGWNYLIDSANATDYFELAYAVSDTDITFPAFASTAFAPSTATLVTTITPVGA